MSIKTGQRITLNESQSWLTLCLLCLPTAVLALDMSALYLALAHIAASLDTTSVEELWILDIYPLMIAGFLMLMGGMSDRWGNRRVLLIGGSAFSCSFYVTNLLYANYSKGSTRHCWCNTYASDPWADK
ncbi:hypothetical protein [Photorhabdus heterorhabditis]|uniref:hypothetical protein n=1 Tax=Photorhabdus heterorhabditis TaxID=880156 RepID=UPI0006C8A9F5|nr:hypothetical protein [Photorhabdus heterorhabditis]